MKIQCVQPVSYLHRDFLKTFKKSRADPTLVKEKNFIKKKCISSKVQVRRYFLIINSFILKKNKSNLEAIFKKT